MKKNHNPELATFTLLNPDFHASVEEGGAQEYANAMEENHTSETRSSSETDE